MALDIDRKSERGKEKKDEQFAGKRWASLTMFLPPVLWRDSGELCVIKNAGYIMHEYKASTISGWKTRGKKKRKIGWP